MKFRGPVVTLAALSAFTTPVLSERLGQVWDTRCTEAAMWATIEGWWQMVVGELIGIADALDSDDDKNLLF